MRDAHKQATIGELCRFGNGNGFRPSDWKREGLPIIRIQNLNGSQNFNYFDGAPDPKWVIEPGDLLFAWAGVRGVSFGPTIWPGPRGVLNQHIFRIVPKPGIDRYWLYLALQEATRRIEANAHGFKSSLVHVHKEDITGQIIDLPPLGEQRKIAEILRTWDKAIEDSSALRAAKGRLHAKIAARLIHDAQYKREPLRDHLCEIADRNRGQRVSRVLSVTNSVGFVLSEDQFAHRVASVDTSNYKIVRRGQYAYNPSRINVGSIARLNGWDDGALSPMYVVFEVGDGLASDFFGHWLRSAEARQRITLAAQGSVRDTVSFGDLASIAIPVPPLDRQHSIAQALNAGRCEITLIEAQTDALKRQKRGLMQRLLTGEWRVAAAGAFVPKAERHASS